ncbi:MAG: hypothetical protein KTR17_08675 [Cellvibrionaceae bacterium]|nr:hypothetical protein [Cellvibrionaceae bacterium]
MLNSFGVINRLNYSKFVIFTEKIEVEGVRSQYTAGRKGDFDVSQLCFCLGAQRLLPPRAELDSVRGPAVDVVAAFWEGTNDEIEHELK